MSKANGKTTRKKQAKCTDPDASPVNGQVPPKDTRWKPGQSGNPKGSRPGLKMLPLLRKELEKNNAAKAKAIIRKWIAQALEGDYRHLREIVDRIDGRVLERVEFTGESEIRIHVTYDELPEGIER